MILVKFYFILVIAIVLISIGSYLSFAPEFSDRGGIFPLEGISIVHSENISITNRTFNLLVTEEPQTILIDFDVSFLNKNEPGFVAMVIPYPGGITGYRFCWTSHPFLEIDARIIFRDYPCQFTSDDELYKEDQIHYEWKYEIYSDLDSVSSGIHIVELNFFDEPKNLEIKEFIERKFAGTLLNTWLEDKLPKEVKITLNSIYDKVNPSPLTDPVPVKTEDNKDNDDISYVWQINENNKRFLVEFFSSEQQPYQKYFPFLALITLALGIALFVMTFGQLLSIKHNRDVVKKHLKEDFNEIDSKLVSAISKLELDLPEVEPKGSIIEDLLSKKLTPSRLMLQYVTGFHFKTWDASLSRISDLKLEEIKKLSILHGFIFDINRDPELKIRPTVESLQKILDDDKMDDTKKRESLSNYLKSSFDLRLSYYKQGHLHIHDDLKEIEWIKLPDHELS